jgi:hypothetical protein
MSRIPPAVVQQRAYDALQKLLDLGLRQKDVASALSVSQGAVSHVNGILSHPDFHISPKMAEALERLVQNTCLRRAISVVEGWALAVIETCNSQGAVVDETVRSQVRAAIVAGLAGAVEPGAPVRFELPPEIVGALASLGDDGWIFVRRSRSSGENQNCQIDLLGQLSLLRSAVAEHYVAIHELGHLIEKIEAELPAADTRRQPKAAY